MFMRKRPETVTIGNGTEGALVLSYIKKIATSKACVVLERIERVCVRVIPHSGRDGEILFLSRR